MFKSSFDLKLLEFELSEMVENYDSFKHDNLEAISFLKNIKGKINQIIVLRASRYA